MQKTAYHFHSSTATSQNLLSGPSPPFPISRLLSLSLTPANSVLCMNHSTRSSAPHSLSETTTLSAVPCCADPMAISEGNESLGAADSPYSLSDPNVPSLRRRHAAAAADEVAAVASESENLSENSCHLSGEASPSSDAGRDHGVGAGDGPVDSANSVTDGSAKDEKLAAGDQSGLEYAMKFVYRASSPAHRKVKESPLSSNNIFKQVSNCLASVF